MPCLKFLKSYYCNTGIYLSVPYITLETTGNVRRPISDFFIIHYKIRLTCSYLYLVSTLLDVKAR